MSPSRAERLQCLAVSTTALLLFAYLLWFRVDRISSDFWMMDDQIGDWDLVQGSFRLLPLMGPAKTGGGTHLGPAYYWWLWLARHAFSPWTGRLPHAAGLAVSALDALSFSLLFVAIVQLGVPPAGAAAAVLLAASVPYEAALARAGWNPIFALACSNLALSAYVFCSRRANVWTVAAVAGLAWLGVTAHLSAIPLAAALVAGLLARAVQAGPRAVALSALAVGLVVALLQVPWFIGLRTAEGGETAVTRSLEALLGQPMRLFGMRGSAFVWSDGSSLLFRSSAVPSWVARGLLAAAFGSLVVGAVRARVDVWLALSICLTVAAAASAYNLLVEPLQTYFLIPLLGAFATALALMLPIWCRRSFPRQAVGWTALVLVLAMQPRRWTERQGDHSYPLYAAVVRGARSVAQSGVAVRRADGPADDTMPTSTTPLVRWLGGRIDPAAPVVARIARDGTVTYAPGD